jgi:hypothetical protein
MKSQIRTVCAPTDTQTKHLSNTNLEYYHYSSLLGFACALAENNQYENNKDSRTLFIMTGKRK